jgi:hypothetical protein
MSNSAKHHYVPKAILRNFRVQGDSVLYATREKPKPTLRNIDSIFRRIRYNSVQKKDGSHDDTVERFFAEELDNYIPDWVTQFSAVKSAGSIKFQKTASRGRFIQFFYNHMKRTPDFIEPIAASVAEEVFARDLVNEFEAKNGPMTQEGINLLEDEAFRARTLANVRVTNFSQQSEKIMSTLANLRIVVAVPSNLKKTFVVGSQPVARFEDYPFQPLGEKGVELWTSLAPKLAVGFVASRLEDGPISLNDLAVRKLNIAFARNSRAIAGTSGKLILSLATSEW